jgi:hypothetical protein
MIFFLSETLTKANGDIMGKFTYLRI